MNQFPPSPRIFHFQKFTEIFSSQGAPPVSTTPAANFSTNFASFVDTPVANFATGVNNTGGKFPPVSVAPAANLPPVYTTPVVNKGHNYQTADNLKLEKNLSIC